MALFTHILGTYKGRKLGRRAPGQASIERRN